MHVRNMTLEQLACDPLQNVDHVEKQCGSIMFMAKEKKKKKKKGIGDVCRGP